MRGLLGAIALTYAANGLRTSGRSRVYKPVTRESVCVDRKM